MEQLSSKIYYKRILPTVLLLCFFHILVSIAFISEYEKPLRANHNGVIGFGFLLFIFIIIDIIALGIFYHSRGKIRIFDDKIIIKHSKSINEILYSDVISINLYGLKSYEKYNLPQRDEAIEIATNSNQKYYIIPDYYSNGKEMRQLLFCNFNLGTAKDLALSESYSDPLELKSLNKWKVFNANSIIFLIIAALPIFIIISSKAYIFPLLAIIILLVYIASYFANFIQYNDKFLVIRNNIRLWSSRAFLIQNIRYIYFEQISKGPLEIIFIFKDFSKKRYPIESVGRKNLKALCEILAEKGVQIDNDTL